jgi:hypothetical protein
MLHVKQAALNPSYFTYTLKYFWRILRLRSARFPVMHNEIRIRRDNFTLWIVPDEKGQYYEKIERSKISSFWDRVKLRKGWRLPDFELRPIKGHMEWILREFPFPKLSPSPSNKGRLRVSTPVSLYFIYGWTQREGMGLLEYAGHAFLAWRSSWRCLVYISIIDQSHTGASGVVCHSWQAARTVHHVQNHNTPLGPSPSSQPGEPPCWVSPLGVSLNG